MTVLTVLTMLKMFTILTMLTMLTMLTYLVDNIEYCRQVEEEGEMKLQESETSADDASNNVVNVD